VTAAYLHFTCLFIVRYVCDTQRTSKGQEVFDKVCEHLEIATNEKEYFACSFRDEKKTRVSILLVFLSSVF